MSVSTTKQDMVAKTTVLAHTAIREFILERRVPRPQGIRRARNGAVPIDLSVVDHEVWVDATDAKYVGTENLNHAGQIYARVAWAGRVPSPIGDVAVVLRIVQRVGETALVATGGAA